MSLKRFEVSHGRRRIVVGLFIFTESYDSPNNHKTDELLLRILRLLAHSKKLRDFYGARRYKTVLQESAHINCRPLRGQSVHLPQTVNSPDPLFIFIIYVSVYNNSMYC